ncbi:GNAT family N-acetyltransferase [Aquibium sp. A9E412]|uniref:GNAT family N-acetyltransferase n=1 Tax=Aquibium sp. A9E412 TaxID=2976767 RepID=UPI0025B01FC1|nr:GNAT family N-acetyltransferase [Aquibium sp. A9E412]MDN2565708.1 GNAT family N-acetyltransferase [Aquibium sp. A9E412]
MTDQSPPAVSLLHLKDAHELAPLLAAYAQALKRGAPRRPDEFYAETLLQDRRAELLGARFGDRLAGFAIFHDLPEPVSGMRYGLCDHLYVHHAERGRGVGKALVDALAAHAEERGWSRLMLNAPRFPEDGRRLYARLAEPADWSSFVIRFEHG